MVVAEIESNSSNLSRKQVKHTFSKGISNVVKERSVGPQRCLFQSGWTTCGLLRWWLVMSQLIEDSSRAPGANDFGHSYQNRWPRVATVKTYMSSINLPLTDVSTYKVFTGDNRSSLCTLCCTEPGMKPDGKEIILVIRNLFLEQRPHEEKKVSILSVSRDHTQIVHILKSDKPKGTLRMIYFSPLE